MSAAPAPTPTPVRDGDDPVAHTRVPNLLLQYIIPRLSGPEQACVLFIMRLTWGFAKPGGEPGERKQYDRIAISQFVDGIRKPGPPGRTWVWHLGTGLSRTAVIEALKKLESRDLLKVTFECPTGLTPGGRPTGCGWGEPGQDSPGRPVVDPKTKAHKCPRCNRSLNKVYGLKTLTRGRVKRFLSSTDPNGCEWDFDPESGQFYVLEAGHAPEEIELTLDDLRAQLWHPELVEKILAHAASSRKTGKLSDVAIRRQFLEPVIEFQNTGVYLTPGDDPVPLTEELLAHGLQEVVRRRIAAGARSKNWLGYAKAVIKSQMIRRSGDVAQVVAEAKLVPVVEQLEQCADLNRAGNRGEARQLLSELLSGGLDAIVPEFDGDRPLARRHLLEAFKRGKSDYRGIRDYAPINDFLPQWTWEEDEAGQNG